MSKRDDKRDKADDNAERDAEPTFQSEAVAAFVAAVGATIAQAREDGTNFAKVDVVETLRPQLEDLDREVTETIEKRDRKISDLVSLVNQKTVDFNQLKGQRDRERERLPTKAKEEFAEAMLNVVDAVDAAAKAMRGADEKVLEGILSISRMMDSNLKTHGFLKIDGLHEKADPQYHQSVGETESTEHDEGIVIEVVQGGYRNETTGNVLRHARVIVAKKPTIDAELHAESSVTARGPD